VESGRSIRLARWSVSAQHRRVKLIYKLLAIASAGVSAVLFSPSANACSIAQRKLTVAQIRQQANDDFRRASVAVDAEVVEPMGFGSEWKPGFAPIAYLRITRVWKGTIQEEVFPVVYITSCDISLEKKGEKLRILLTGKGVFRADQTMNGAGVRDEETYQAEIDRLFGHKRSPALAHFPGAIAPPVR
jgi:hypothetical protein